MGLEAAICTVYYRARSFGDLHQCGDEVPVARVTLTLLPQSPLYLRR